MRATVRTTSDTLDSSRLRARESVQLSVLGREEASTYYTHVLRYRQKMGTVIGSRNVSSLEFGSALGFSYF